jgi:2-methylaconitate cis-trans-isomerase PrpF
MTQTAIPYLFMRGGSSRGPYFNRADLPENPETLSQVLIAAVGSGHRLNIDGVGGGDAVTTKVAMLSPSDDEWADVDYFFAQVSVEDQLVDYKPTCGNILSGVGPAAIEMGLVPAAAEQTEVKIRAVNTGASIVATVETPDGEVNYDGSVAIAGVPGKAAPVALSFSGVCGSCTSGLLPTGAVKNTIDGIEVTCMDAAMPLVIARAADFNLTGYESVAELDNNKAFFARMEAIRLKAGALMGLGDCRDSVIPKFGLVAAPVEGGTMTARYFMPWKTHHAMAVTGAQCLAACAMAPGSVADGLVQRPEGVPVNVTLEHPTGTIEVVIDCQCEGDFDVNSVGLVRTARKLADGNLYIPAAIWSGH